MPIPGLRAIWCMTRDPKASVSDGGKQKRCQRDICCSTAKYHVFAPFNFITTDDEHIMTRPVTESTVFALWPVMMWHHTKQWKFAGRLKRTCVEDNVHNRHFFSFKCSSHMNLPWRDFFGKNHGNCTWAVNINTTVHNTQYLLGLCLRLQWAPYRKKHTSAHSTCIATHGINFWKRRY